MARCCILLCANTTSNIIRHVPVILLKMTLFLLVLLESAELQAAIKYGSTTCMLIVQRVPCQAHALHSTIAIDKLNSPLDPMLQDL